MFALTTLVYPVLLGALCLGAGLLVDRLGGAFLPAPLLLPVGAAALIAASQLTSYVHALAQVRGYLATLTNAQIEQTTSTSQAAHEVAESTEPWAAVGSAIAGSLFGLEIIAADIADHADNATRFVEVGAGPIPAPTGNDRTSIVCFQDADRPGSLYGILGRFAARDINLTRLESRPTKRGLGEYCFVIEFDGHVGDDIIADCLADLQAHLVRVKFLGSYPVTGEGSTDRRQEVGDARRSANEWIASLRARISD